MIVLLLVCLAVAVTTGLLVLGDESGNGILASTLAVSGGEGGEAWEEVHGFSGSFTLFLVVLDVGGGAWAHKDHSSSRVQVPSRRGTGNPDRHRSGPALGASEPPARLGEVGVEFCSSGEDFGNEGSNRVEIVAIVYLSDRDRA